MAKYIFICLFWTISQLACAQTSYKVNSAGGLNLRESASTNSKTITSLPDGTKVTVIDKTNSKWWKVKVDGKTGYVSSDYLKEDRSSKNNSKTTQSTSNNSNNNSNASKNNSSQKTKLSNSSINSPGSWAAGLRVGDPTGLTVKKYLHRNRAFEFNFGRTSYWGYNYRNRFYRYDRYRDYDYRGYDRGNALSFQFHYLYHKNISGAEGLQWYLGFGPQLRVKSYTYHYDYRVYHGPGPNDYTRQRGADRVNDYDFGIDGVIGMEYKFNNSPISVFGELDLFMEVFDHPFYFRGQGGLGIRIHF